MGFAASVWSRAQKALTPGGAKGFLMDPVEFRLLRFSPQTCSTFSLNTDPWLWATWTKLHFSSPSVVLWLCNPEFRTGWCFPSTVQQLWHLWSNRMKGHKALLIQDSERATDFVVFLLHVLWYHPCRSPHNIKYWSTFKNGNFSRTKDIQDSQRLNSCQMMGKKKTKTILPLPINP